MKSHLKSFLTLALTLLLLYWVLSKVGWEALLNTLRQADPIYVILSLSITPLLILVSVIKWQILLKSQGIVASLSRLYALYLVGYFFNNFLPSNVGGDVIRAYELGNHTERRAEAIASVFMERFTGFVMLVVLAAVSFFTNLTLREDTGLTIALMVAIMGGLIGLLWFMLDARLLTFIAHRVSFSPLLRKYADKFQKFHTSVYAYRKRWRTLTLVFVLSLIFIIGAILNVYVSAMAFQKSVSLLGVAVIVPVILIVAMMPLTFNGIGLQEWAYVLLFSWLGIPASVGLSTVILIRAKTIMVAIIGGAFYPTLKLKQGTLSSVDAD